MEFDEQGLIHDSIRLKELQALPLERKVGITTARIIEWYKHYDGQVYISFSGGKDSTVLLHIARQIFPDIEAVFINTGLEYPEIQSFAKSFSNVTVLRPTMPFNEVIKTYGYPFISKEISECVYQGRKSIESGGNCYSYRLQKLYGTAKDKNGNKSLYCHEKYEPLLHTDFILSHMCCNIMKKKPAHQYNKIKKPITAQTADESNLRKQKWLKNGCNGFNMKSPISNPMSFWTEQDILQYIKQMNIPICSVYGNIEPMADGGQVAFDLYGENCKLCTTGCSRTGCIFCGYGSHLEKGMGRFERLKLTHPKQYAYCMGGGEFDIDGIWKPNKQGLGMGYVIDELNKLYGENFIKK